MNRSKLHIVITCTLALLIFFAVFLTTEIIRKKLHNKLVDDYAEQELLLAHNIARTLEAEIQSAKSQLMLMAEDPVIRDGEAKACIQKLQSTLIQIGSDLGNVGRVDASGNFRCSLNTALVGTEASKLGQYITTIFNDPSHNAVMSRAIKAPGAPGYLTALHVPVWNEGKFDGTLGGAIYLDDLQKKYLEEIVFAERGFVALYDDDGTVLYHKDKEIIGLNISAEAFRVRLGDLRPFELMLQNIKEGRSGIQRYLHVTEGEKIAAYVPVEVISGRKWMVLVTVPIDDVNADLVKFGVNRLLTFIWVLALIVVVITTLGFIWISIRFVFKPIKQIQEMKSDFVSLVSHQLKTPVAQIKGYVDNMLDGLTGPITEKQREYLHDMLNVANKNSKLIDDLLNVSRIERGMLKANIETLDLKALLDDVLAPLRDVAARKGVKLIEKLPKQQVMIQGDAVKTREAIRNIIDNALKFTEASKTVEVSFEEENVMAVIRIKDEGAGIDPDVQKELFNKNRVWFGKVKASGAGLGLFLSKQFIEITGGSIIFSSVLGKGTEFVVKLKKAN
ncbi:MAG TPA: ATP-binding protein [Candidatus Paceibacterota bacterium]|nr:ATP-binding protein [Candidatus Paceibacterota bacterium]